MIRHVYLYKLKPGVSHQEVAQHLLSLRDHIPQIADMEVGFNFKPAENPYDLIESCAFSTLEDFRTFGADPYHEEIRQYMKTAMECGVKIDYGME